MKIRVSRLIRIQMRLFMRYRQLFLPHLLISLAYLGLNLAAVFAFDTALHDLLQGFLFLGLLPVLYAPFMSYAFYQQSVLSNMQDIYGSVRGGRIADRIAVLTAAFIAILMILLPAWFVSLFCLFREQASFWAVWDFSYAYLMHVVGPCLVGLLLGLWLSVRAERWTACFAMILYVFLGSPAVNVLRATEIPSGITAVTDAIIERVRNLFNMGYPFILEAFDPLYGYAHSSWSALRLLLWAAVLAVLIFVVNQVSSGRSQRVLRRIELGIVAATLITGILIQSILPPRDRDVNILSSRVWNGANLDLLQYVAQKGSQLGIDAPAELGYVISRYELDVNLLFSLRVQARLTLDGVFPEEGVVLTLYRGYRVNQVFDDQGKQLSFEQIGDQLRIRLESATGPKQIRFSYSGYSPAFYANDQAAILLGSFPWYPMTGVKTVYSRSTGSKAGSSYPVGNRVPLASFDVRVHGTNRAVVSNLPQIATRHFVGETTALTMMSGAFTILPADSQVRNRLFHEGDATASDLMFFRSIAKAPLEQSIPATLRRFYDYSGDPFWLEQLKKPVLVAGDHLSRILWNPPILLFDDVIIYAHQDNWMLDRTSTIAPLLQISNDRSPLLQCWLMESWDNDSVTHQLAEHLRNIDVSSMNSGVAYRCLSNIRKALRLTDEKTIRRDIYQYITGMSRTAEAEAAWIQDYVEKLQSEVKNND